MRYNKSPKADDGVCEAQLTRGGENTLQGVRGNTPVCKKGSVKDVENVPRNSSLTAKTALMDEVMCEEKAQDEEVYQGKDEALQWV